MRDAAEALERARVAYGRRDWIAAQEAFTAAREGLSLGPDDAYALANCAWWMGDLLGALPALQEAYHRYLEVEQPAQAALVAVEVGYTLLLRGEVAQGSGWMRRAARLLEGLPAQVEHGYLLFVDFETAFDAHDLEVAAELAGEIAALGERLGAPALLALGALGRGRVLIRRGEVAEGFALLDEAMVATVIDRIDPAWAGSIYCHLMLACSEIADLQRAGEWTQVAARWCERMPGAGPFMGICRVNRAELLRVRGAWDEAERELARVLDELADVAGEVVAEAHYQRGELRRLRGDLAGAETSYREAHRLGREPQPGLALLGLERGRIAAASASIRSSLAAAEQEPLARARLLPAAVEICLAGGDVAGARAAADELGQLATRYGTNGFAARSSTARGRVLVADGDAAGALPPLREALRTWQQLGAASEVARVRRLLAEAYDAVGDADAADLERQAARAERARLGVPAASDASEAGRRSEVLTSREAQILGLVAAGWSNQEIAADLVLSIRTVERHLATVYQKLGVHGRSARAAAVSYALREGLLAPS
jgi:ATP/maltotriose-dependent transcriptional regulator MalT